MIRLGGLEFIGGNDQIRQIGIEYSVDGMIRLDKSEFDIQ
jgi:hypothetical protein